MILVVDSDNFADTVKRHLGDVTSAKRVVYVSRFTVPGGGEGYHLSAALPEGNLLIQSYVLVGARQRFVISGGEGNRIGDQQFDSIMDDLRSNSFTIAQGQFTDFAVASARQGAAQEDVNAPEEQGSLFIACIAYLTADEEAGIWVDAYPSRPTEQQVLRAMYDEFVRTGDLSDTSYDEFIDGSRPNVEIVAPKDAAGWAAQKGNE